MDNDDANCLRHAKSDQMRIPGSSPRFRNAASAMGDPGRELSHVRTAHRNVALGDHLGTRLPTLLPDGFSRGRPGWRVRSPPLHRAPAGRQVRRTASGPLSAGQGYRRPRRALHRNDGLETRHAEDVISSGDKVVARTRVTGTSTGTLMGMPPTGKSVNVQVIDILRFGDDGLVREHWGVMDMMSMMQQLGVAAQGPPG